MTDLASVALMVYLGPGRADRPTYDDLVSVIGSLQAEVDSLRDALEDARRDYGPCRCYGPVVCAACSSDPGDCECADSYELLAEELAADDGEDVADLDPLTRTLLGYPSGIHCHGDDGRCLSGHCGDADA